MFDWRRYLPDLRRLPADELASLALTKLLSLMGLGGVVTAITSSLTPPNGLNALDWLIVFFCVCFAIAGLWFLIETIRFNKQRRLASGFTEAVSNSPKSDEGGRPVVFALISGWGDGFRLHSIGNDKDGTEIQSEEIVLNVEAVAKLQNVRLEITLSSLIGTSKRNVIVQISNDRFSGTVPKGMEQSFVIMRRYFWNVHTSYNIPGKDIREGIQVRVEKEVIFFPENPLATKGEIDHFYHLDFVIYHDDGPDKASIALDLRRKRVFPQSLIFNIKNVEMKKP